MNDLETVLSELEFRRVRRRVSMNRLAAAVRNSGTAALILLLRLAAPAIAR